ncbi:kinase-like domain-containing protein [Phascolomyces articulosus]|uniref:non-specific serine/threonine protein kinase n=1 Tax=Phascolomyces articulosus TaxID=60185 RepID=A0AAD5PBN3_9FUNG|nr:kinase-like domain-containing protein [Phascolomyces articulosus]
MHQSPQRHPRIPEQQSIGQTLPPVPVGIDTNNTPQLPLGAMQNGTRVQVQKYQVIVHNFIAEGGFAHVYLARIEGKSGYVVLKRVAVPDNERLKTVEKEIAFMRRLGDHKNITRYYASRIDPLSSGGFEALILMEYCPGGGVIDLMNRRLQQRLTEPEVLKIFSDVCEALAYMHYCNPPVLHRDLKVENILILSQDHYKLCDFGSAALSKGDFVPTNLQEIQKIEDDIQRHTTLQYRAPEMIDIYQRKPINEKGDIWALGVLLYKLCYYTTPFEEQGQLAILNARYSIPNQPHFSDGLKRLIISLLQENQYQRPNVYQVLKAVCQLRNVECPIRNIYPDNQPHAELTHRSNPQMESPSSIFERLPTPPQQVLDIVPMRRGRPIRHAKTDSQSERQHIKTFDPFDPSQVAGSTVTNSSTPGISECNHQQGSADIDDAFALNELNSKAVVDDNQEVRSSMTFDSDFHPIQRPQPSDNTPAPSSPDISKSNSYQPLSNHSSGRINVINSSEHHLSEQLTGENNELPVWQQQMPIKSKASTISNNTKKNNQLQVVRSQLSSSSSSDKNNDVHQPIVVTRTTKADELPTLRNNVSSSIEARLSALKMSVEGTSSISTSPTAKDHSTTLTMSNNSQLPPLKPSRSSGKPAPPPKPARFRIAQNATTVSPSAGGAPPPLKPSKSTTMDVTDFETKFPSIEELYKQLPVAAATALGSTESK